MDIRTRLELITLPLRALALLVLVLLAYYFGHSDPVQAWLQETPETGIVAKYTRDGHPWRIFYDRDRNGEWDMWIDERSGGPMIVSIDNNGDGQADRTEDEFGNALSSWRTMQIRAKKTFADVIRTPLQIQYLGIALMLYIVLEMAVRSLRPSS